MDIVWKTPQKPTLRGGGRHLVIKKINGSNYSSKNERQRISMLLELVPETGLCVNHLSLPLPQIQKLSTQVKQNHMQYY